MWQFVIWKRKNPSRKIIVAIKRLDSGVRISSVHFSCSVLSDSLQHHGLQHTRSPCLSPMPGFYSNSCSLSQWCHPTIASFIVPFFSHLQSFPVSGSFPMSQFFASGGQSFSFNIRPSNEQPGLISFRMDWLDLLAVQGTLKSLLQHHSSKASIPWCSVFFIVQLSHPYMTTGKTIALTRRTFVWNHNSCLILHQWEKGWLVSNLDLLLLSAI